MNDLNFSTETVTASEMSSDSQHQQSPTSLAKVGHWQGGLQLRYALSDEGKTFIAEKTHRGPYTVQRPFYPEGHICHSILLHPPGGLVEGDELSLNVHCDVGSHCFLTTPSAGKVYECETDFAAQKQVFHIHDRAVMEWFPQEMIVYDRSKSQLQTEIQLQGSGKFVGWEFVCLGRPIAADHFSKGFLQQKISVFRDDKPLLLERTIFDAESELRQQAHGLADYQGMGLFLMTGALPQHLELAREVVAALETEVNANLQIGFTLIDDLLLGRVLMNQSRFAKTALVSVWSALREPVLATPAILPRIWQT